MVHVPNPPSQARLRALAAKYGRLVAWRGSRDGEGTRATRAELRALAADFPGCLRELDTLGGPELARRAVACAAAATDPGLIEPWMAWIDGYHALVQRALAARQARLSGAAAPTDTFEREVLAPPDGRMGIVVLRALAAQFDVPAATIAVALFPLRRPSPYQL